MQHNTWIGRRRIFAAAFFYDGSVKTGVIRVRKLFGFLVAATIFILLPVVAARAQQPSQDDATQQQPAPGQPQQENGGQEPMPQQETPQEQPAQPQATPEQTPKQPAAQTPGKYSLTDAVSIELPREWRKLDSDQIPPPAELASYAPPFHLSGLVELLNSDEGAILQLATSDNPLVGRDPYWLDTQMHAPSGSGMSLPDFLFYFFLPPSTHCMEKVLSNLENATRVPPTDASNPSALQVSYTCPFAATLPDFYAARVSSGITFRHDATTGSHALGAFRDFYIVPMEEVDFDGLTFFVFEAQESDRVGPDATTYFNLPDTMQGARADFFWAIGAPSPFPFSASSSPDGSDAKNIRLIHLAYASAGTGPGGREEFIRLLHLVRAR
jgi:hypothetical protein